MSRRWIFASVLAVLAGCASTVRPARVADSVQLQDGEGIIVYRMNCGPGVAWAEFYESGRSAAGYFAGFKRAGALLCPEGLQTKRVKAGTYYLGKIGYQSWIDLEEAKAMQFTVAAGKINYIGHIRIPSTSEKRGTTTVVLISDPEVTDRSVEARIWLAENQPSLKQTYEFVEALAIARPSVERPGD